MATAFRIMILLAFAFAGRAQSDQVSIRRASSPTEYVQCRQVQEFNAAVRRELFDRVKACEEREMSRWDPNYSICSVSGVQVGTTRGCAGSLLDWCRVSNATDEADRECREDVRRAKEMQKLVTAADEKEIQSDEMRALLHDLASGAAKLTELMKPGVAAKLARSQITRMGTIGDNTIVQLEEALRALNGFDGAPDRTLRDDLYRSSSHPVVRLSAIVAQGGSAAAEDLKIVEIVKRYALSGDGISADLIGDAINRGIVSRNASNPLAWHALAVGLGNASAATDIGTHSLREGDVSSSEAWYRVASDMGSPAGMASLANLLWDKGQKGEAMLLAARLEKLGNPRVQKLKFRGEMTASLPPPPSIIRMAPRSAPTPRPVSPPEALHQENMPDSCGLAGVITYECVWGEKKGDIIQWKTTPEVLVLTNGNIPPLPPHGDRNYQAYMIGPGDPPLRLRCGTQSRTWVLDSYYRLRRTEIWTVTADSVTMEQDATSEGELNRLRCNRKR
ncbi:MAG TPA: hypothetical protein VEK79_00770 [Thermoanaerobaculia bacterium]|nr:hypothetical protein [Thermoanaerobaculia bacterium]